RPYIRDQCRREPERDHVGKTVVLDAERALGAGEARNPPVQPVEHHRDEDRHRRQLEAPVHRLDDRVEPGEERSGGDEIRQPVDAVAAEPVLEQAVVTPGRRFQVHARQLNSASTLAPAYTMSPTRARGTASSGRYTSTREPKRMKPKRSPRRSRIPGLT